MTLDLLQEILYETFISEKQSVSLYEKEKKKKKVAGNQDIKQPSFIKEVR